MIQILCVQSEKRYKDRELEEARKEELLMPVGSARGSLGGELSWRACPTRKGTEGFHMQTSGAKAQSARRARRKSRPLVWFSGLWGARGVARVGHQIVKDCGVARDYPTTGIPDGELTDARLGHTCTSPMRGADPGLAVPLGGMQQSLKYLLIQIPATNDH